MTPKRIIIADDHAIIRTGLQMVLLGTSDMIISDEASNSKELIEKLNVTDFDMVILDISMPGKDATETLKEVKQKWPDTPVVVLTMNSDEIYALRMFRLGASAYISKENSLSNIVDILRIVLSGKKYFTTRQTEMLANTLDHPDKSGQVNCEILSDRELQILCMITSGKKNTEIAENLALSKHTIENHRSNILKKLSVTSNLELVRYAYQLGIIR